MPFELDDYDVSILKSLLKDGRKSFREVSRETGITCPTVKARFDRLVNVGFIKSVSPILDFSIIQHTTRKPEADDNAEASRALAQQEHKHNSNARMANSNIKKGMKIKLDCDFCHGPVLGDPYVFKFANYERFFCCTACMVGYKQKYAGRIESIKRQFKEGEKIRNFC